MSILVVPPICAIPLCISSYIFCTSSLHSFGDIMYKTLRAVHTSAGFPFTVLNRVAAVCMQLISRL